MARKLTAHDVFTPSSFPEHTYVARRDDDLEEKLRFALKTKGQIVSLSGPSKSGKTVLVEKVIGKDNLIPIAGAGLRDPEQVWTRVLDFMDAPLEVAGSKALQLSTSARGGAKAEANIVLAKGDVSGDMSAGVTRTTGTSERKARRGLEHVIDEIAGSPFVILVDDFHYMAREVQVEVAKQLKEAARREVKIVTAAVPHRADDVVRANPELRGRVSAVDVAYWTLEDLAQIAASGFAALNVEISPASAERLARESAGSPQLMQALCLYACFAFGTTERLARRSPKGISDEELVKACRLTSTVTDFRSLVDALEAGPRTRGSERKTYTFKDGTTGDVYRVILKALAAEPLRLVFPYDDVVQRVRSVCEGEFPIGSSVTVACAHMAKLAAEQLATQLVLDWDEGEQVLEIPDPYLLFYLRWSDRLTRSEA